MFAFLILILLSSAEGTHLHSWLLLLYNLYTKTVWFDMDIDPPAVTALLLK